MTQPPYGDPHQPPIGQPPHQDPAQPPQQYGPPAMPYGQPQPPYLGQPTSAQPYPDPSYQPQYPGQPMPGADFGQPTQPYPGQPTSAQPYPGQPTSAQPYPGQPTSAQPYPGQPMPGADFGQPTQPYPGQPTSAQPYPGQPMPGAEFGQPGFPPPGPGYPPYGAQPPKKRRGVLIASIVAVVTILLCGGGGIAAFVMVRAGAETGEGAAEPVAAVKDFLTAVYTDQDADKAAKLVCSEARNEEAIAKKVDEIKDYANTYNKPRFQWEAPTVDDQNDERAIISVKLTMTTGDEKTAKQDLKFTVVQKTGWWVCEVG